MIRADHLPPRPWGDGCRSWDLVDRTDMIVAQEDMPPGTSEQWHRHQTARQFFYVLAGHLAVAFPDRIERLQAGEGLEISPGQEHRVFNDSAASVQFLAIASPTTKGDRVMVADPTTGA